MNKNSQKFHWAQRMIVAFLLLMAPCCLAQSEAMDDGSVWKTRFETFLKVVRESSIRNYDWEEVDWQVYLSNQLARLPIKNKDQFDLAVLGALTDLEDGHSFYASYYAQKMTQEELVNKEPTFDVQEGIGVVKVPGFDPMGNNHETSEEVSNAWVKHFHEQLGKTVPYVSKGWIIDLTENFGGAMHPMIAGLGIFIEPGEVSGFYFYGPSKIQETTVVSFDGQSFAFDGETGLVYESKCQAAKNILPVIVLIGERTASSGEFLALALQRQSNTTLIGMPSGGFASGNVVHMLPDNLGWYALTSGFAFDAENKILFSKKVDPAIVVEGDKEQLLQKAKSMILKSTECPDESASVDELKKVTDMF